MALEADLWPRSATSRNLVEQPYAKGQNFWRKLSDLDSDARRVKLVLDMCICAGIYVI